MVRKQLAAGVVGRIRASRMSAEKHRPTKFILEATRMRSKRFTVKELAIVLAGAVFLCGICLGDAAGDLEQARGLLAGGDTEGARTALAGIVTEYPDSEQAIWAQSELARMELRLGNDGAAEAVIANLKTAYSGNPYTAHALHDIGYLYQGRRRYGEAREIFEYIVQNFPGNEYEVWALGGVASVSLKLGDTAAGNAAADRLIAEFAADSNMPFLANDVGAGYLRCKEYGRAEQFFTRALNGEPAAEQKMWARAGLAKAKVGLGECGEAHSVVEQLIGEFGGNEQLAEQLNDIGGSFKQAGREQDAETVYGVMVENYPSSKAVQRLQLSTLSRQIELLIRAEKPVEARAAVSSMIAGYGSSPDIARTLYSIARKYEDGHYQEEADGLYTTILSDYSDSEEAGKAELGKKALAAASLVRGGSDELVQQKVSELLADANYAGNPELALRIFLIGEEYYFKVKDARAQGLYEAADALYGKGAAIWERCIDEAPVSPHTAHAYYWMGHYYSSQRQYALAIENYQAVVGQWPEFAFAWSAQLSIGTCYLGMKRGGEMTAAYADLEAEKALKIVEYGYADTEGFLRSLVALGNLYFSKGQWRTGADYYQRYLGALSEDKKPPMAMYRYAKCLERSGRRPAAIGVYEEFLAKADPDSPQYKTVKRRFKNL